MKKLPISVENFKEIVKGGYYYVDKSLLIKDVIELPGKVKLITRPRRFGKTLNIDMMMKFFSIDEEENLFENLKIWNEKEIVKEYYRKYPVIYVSFKSLKGSNRKDAYERVKNELSRIPGRYKNEIKNKGYRRYYTAPLKKR